MYCHILKKHLTYEEYQAFYQELGALPTGTVWFGGWEVVHCNNVILQMEY